MKQKTLGIAGGGQLGRMLVQAAQKLQIKTIVLDPTHKSPAGQIADSQIVGSYKDPKQVRNLAKKVDYLTFEIEGTNAKVLKGLKKDGMHIQPEGETLELIQDKFKQKQHLKSTKIPTPDFARVSNSKDIETAVSILGLPIVLKTRFHGFDGRGNFVINKKNDIKIALKKLSGQKLYAEKFIFFKKELATQVVKDVKGKIVCYPIVETIQKNNICHEVIAPAKINNSVAKQATSLAKKVVLNLKGAGVFGIEMFLTDKNKVIINEIAPRVHNSGHYTIEACTTSQFEQQVRVACKLPVGSTKMKVPVAVMVNILGQRNGKTQLKGQQKLQKMENTYLHIYGKSETKIDRKMGHITVLGKTLNKTQQKAETARRMISI